jgi:hypothetical protein
MRKIAFGLGVLLATGGAAFEGIVLAQVAAQRRSLEARIVAARLRDRIWRSQRDEARAAGAKLIARTEDAADPVTDQKIADWLTRYARMQAWFDRHPEQRIPEFQFLKEADWLSVIQGSSSVLESDEDFRRAASGLRARAMDSFEGKLYGAFVAYVKASGGYLPSSTSDLAGYFQPPIEDADAVLQRYEMFATGPAVETGPASQMALGLSRSAIVDPTYDHSAYTVGTNGYGNNGYPDDYPLALVLAREKAEVAYGQANPGKSSRKLDALAPYFQNPADLVQLKALEAAPVKH